MICCNSHVARGSRETAQGCPLYLLQLICSNELSAGSHVPFMGYTCALNQSVLPDLRVGLPVQIFAGDGFELLKLRTVD